MFVAVAPILVTWVITACFGRRPGLGDSPGTRRFQKQGVVALGDTGVAHLAPIFTPRVPHVPILLAVLDAPADDAHDVIDTTTFSRDDSRGVVVQRDSVHPAGDGATGVNLFRHIIGAADLSKLFHGGIRLVIHLRAESAIGKEGGACAAHVLCFAGEICIFADAFVRLLGASQVRLAGVVSDARAGLVGDARDPMVDAECRPTVAGSSIAAVEDMLDAEIDVDTLALAFDLDTVAQRRDCPVCPT